MFQNVYDRTVFEIRKSKTPHRVADAWSRFRVGVGVCGSGQVELSVGRILANELGSDPTGDEVHLSAFFASSFFASGRVYGRLGSWPEPCFEHGDGQPMYGRVNVVGAQFTCGGDCSDPMIHAHMELSSNPVVEVTARLGGDLEQLDTVLVLFG